MRNFIEIGEICEFLSYMMFSHELHVFVYAIKLWRAISLKDI